MSKNVKFDFTDQIVVITGGASGIGAATAEQFAEAGATSIICDFDEEGGKRVMDGILAKGGKADFFKIDVSSRDEAYALKDFVVNKYGRVDVLISNAGVGPLKDENGNQYAGPPLDYIPYKEWERQFKINLMGGVNMATAFRQVFVEQKFGKVVFTSSINAYRPSPLIPQYGSVKVGLAYFCQCYAKEMGEYNINVNAVCPGYVYTDIYAKGGMGMKKLNPVAFKDAQTPKDLVRRAGELNSILHREQTSEDIANGILFLSSDAASEITGQILPIDSGTVLR